MNVETKAASRRFFFVLLPQQGLGWSEFNKCSCSNVCRIRTIEEYHKKKSIFIKLKQNHVMLSRFYVVLWMKGSDIIHWVVFLFLLILWIFCIFSFYKNSELNDSDFRIAGIHKTTISTQLKHSTKAFWKGFIIWNYLLFCF